MRIGLLIIATSRYVQFLEDLVGSARRFFFAGHEVTPFVFTDAASVPRGAVRLPVVHQPWPAMTLKRFHLFCEHAELFEDLDYLFYVDADMRFVAPCDEAALPGRGDRLVAVAHPAFYRRPRWWRRGPRWRPARLPFERNPASLACVADLSQGPYFAGGFNGGFADSFLTMARSLRDAVDHDLERGVVAVWHDESHLNRYLCVQPPKVLPPSYCYPEQGWRHLRHLSPILVALAKDHAYFRGALS